MKSRSSTGVGMKLDLDYNMETMRITDPGIDEQPRKSTPSIYDQIKTKSEVIDAATRDPEPEHAKIQVSGGTSQVKSMLANLKRDRV
jgi:hypothetical protein